MKAKTYLNTPAFKVSHPNQSWGGRQEQILVINSISVNYSMISNNFASGIVDRLLEDRTFMQHFSYWSLLIDAITNFMNDVELTYPMSFLKIIHEIDTDDDLDSGSDGDNEILNKGHKLKI